MPRCPITARAAPVLDRNVIIASVLIAIIMLLWFWLLAPPQPVEPMSPEDPVADPEYVEPTPGPPQDLPAAGLPPVGAPDLIPSTEPDTSLIAPMTGKARLITVETDLYQATFSTKGATLTSFTLKEYAQFDQVTPVRLVDTTSAGALSIAFTTPRSHLIDTRLIHFQTAHESDTLIVGEAPAQLHFETRIGEGALRQTYTFHPGEYEIGLSIDQENPGTWSTREGYELVWEGGIPFTENDPDDEAQASGVYARSGGEMESVLLDGDAFDEQHLSGSVSWVAVKSKYFTTVMIPSGATRGAELIGENIDAQGDASRWENYSMRLLMPQPEGRTDEFRLYVGPMEFYRITDYDLGLYDMVDYGWDFFEWMTRPLAKWIFIPVFTFLASFIPGYGFVIIVFSILIKIVLYPLTKTSYRGMARMRELQPKMEEIKKKYGDNPQKQQEQMMKMYKESGVNPLSGCLPMLLQYPIIIALWLFLPQSIEIRQKGFLWANDLSAPDVILNLPFNIPLYGDFVAGFTLLMGISMIFQMRLQASPTTNPQAKIFTYVFPVIIFAIFNRLASGLSLYYLVYNIVTAIQQQYINRRIAAEMEGEVAGGGRPGKKTGKSGRGKQARSGGARGGKSRTANTRRFGNVPVRRGKGPSKPRKGGPRGGPRSR